MRGATYATTTIKATTTTRSQLLEIAAAERFTGHMPFYHPTDCVEAPKVYY